MIFQRLLLLAFAVGAINSSLVQTVNGELILNVDSANKLLYFSGSTTSLKPFPSGGALSGVIWSTTPPPNVITTNLNIVQTDLFTFSNNAFANLSIDTYDSGTGLTGLVAVGLNMTSNSDTTISGTGNTYSYAAWTTSAIQSLESSNGSQLPLTFGIGTSTLSISVTAVPEPSSLMLLAVGVSFAILRRRKYDAKKHQSCGVAETSVGSFFT